MCNIWKESTHSEMPPKEYAKLPRTLRTINITGGEPFLREDLVEVVRVISTCLPKARLVFSTNGYLTERIIDVMSEIRRFHPDVGVGVSIDGRRDTHDRIRGITGMFDRATTTVRELKSRGFSDLRLGMTLTQENIGELSEVYELSRDLSVEFTVAAAHNSEFYFKTTDNIALDQSCGADNPLNEVVRSQLKSKSIKDWFRAYHTTGICDPSIREGFRSHCNASRSFFFMAPNGDVYPCNILNEKIGNITDVTDWSGLMTPSVEKRIRKIVRDCRTDCWMVCNTRSLIKAHPFRVCIWILRNKM